MFTWIFSEQALHSCLSRALIEIVAMSPDNIQSTDALPGITTQATSGLSGVGSMVGNLYSGTAANIYSSFSGAATTENTTSHSASGGIAALGYTPTPGIIRVADVLKVPIPMKNANFENFYALNERIVAAESCWFVATVSYI